MIRRLLLFGVLMCLLLTIPVDAFAGESSWVGKKVIAKKRDIGIINTDDNGLPVYVGVVTDVGTVLAEKDGWLKITQQGAEGWLKKNEAVLLENAIPYFTQRIRANPEDYIAYGLRAFAWHAKGNLDIALKDYNEAIQLAPGDKTFYNDRAMAYLAKRNYDKAIADCNELIRLDPTYALAFTIRGNVYYYKKDYDKAIADCNEAIRLVPKYAFAFTIRGNVYYNKKDYDKAIADYNEAIRLVPTYAFAFTIRGNVHYFKKDYNKAIADYNEAIRLDPKDAVAFINRGFAYEAKKDYDKALEIYKEAVRLDAQSASAFNYAARLMATCPEATLRDGKKAIELAKRACELNKWKAAGDIDTLAAAYAEAGQFDEAVRYQLQSLEGPAMAKNEGARKRLELYKNKKPYRAE